MRKGKSMQPEKVVFASPAWIQLAQTTLTDLVSAYGNPDDEFSVCEVFLNVPADVNAESTVAWHFFIKGTDLKSGVGEADEVEVRIAVEYEDALAAARRVYAPDDVALAQPRHSLGSAQPPRYLVELHNRLALLTA